MVHLREELTTEDSELLSSQAESILLPERKNARPVVIAFVGLVGSGKSMVAEAAARDLSAVVVSGDAIRIELAKRGRSYEKVRLLAEELALSFLQDGYSVVIDSDFVDDAKRSSLELKLKALQVPLYVVRTLASLDHVNANILEADYEHGTNRFFASASSPLGEIGTVENRGAVIKLREMERRLPHHYVWKEEGGGIWEEKVFPFEVHLTLRTDAADWRGALRRFCVSIQ